MSNAIRDQQERAIEKLTSELKQAKDGLLVSKETNNILSKQVCTPPSRSLPLSHSLSPSLLLLIISSPSILDLYISWSTPSLHYCRSSVESQAGRWEKETYTRRPLLNSSHSLFLPLSWSIYAGRYTTCSCFWTRGWEEGIGDGHWRAKVFKS